MKHYLTFKDEKSDKFWQIEVAGKSFTVTYGKSGSPGTSQTRTFGSEAACLKEAEKLLTEKLKKGYKESGGLPIDESRSGGLDWDSIVTAESPQKAFEQHLRSLGITQVGENALTQLCERITDVKKVNDTLQVFLPWKHSEKLVRLVFKAPYNGKFHKSVPKSFQQFYRAHNGMAYYHDEDRFAALRISSIDGEGRITADGGWECDALEDNEDDNQDVIDYLGRKDLSLEDIICFGAYEGLQDWYVLHPIKKNRVKEPAIVFFTHGGCSMNDKFSQDTFMDFLILELQKWILH